MVSEYDDHYREFTKFLSQNELKFTKQRKDILVEVFSIHSHFEIETFIDELHVKNKSISRGTVYSTIKLLLQSGMIRKIRTPSNKVFYEHVFGYEHHDHLICIDCGKVIEIKDEIIEKRQVELLKENNFKITSHTYNIYGYCSTCQ